MIRYRNLALFAACVLAALVACGTLGSDVDLARRAPESGQISSGGSGGANSCAPLNGACSRGTDCCSGLCDAALGQCVSVLSECATAGASCASAIECCGRSCVGGTCGERCISDGQTCSKGDDCCGGSCDAGLCSALNDQCATAGNSCGASDDCCSGWCDAGTCALASSFCTQPGDVCGADEQCCTGVCEKQPGASLGTCATAPPGASNCNGVAGTVCSDCNDCCSRLCEVYEPSGVSICQPASGCRVTGELCRHDVDCCGGSLDGDLAGAGNVTCDRALGAEFGICRNARACSPQGNVCHFADYACSISAAANRCCDGTDSPGVCELDSDGIPRCNALGGTCVAPGAQCATSADCCDGGRCVVDASGTLRCDEPLSACVSEGGPCATSAECCNEADCLPVLGSLEGRCQLSSTAPLSAGGAGN